MISEADIKFPDIPFRKTAVLIMIGLLLYFGYLYIVGFESVKNTLASVDLWLVLLAIIIALVGNIFHTAGWWIFLNDMGYKLSLPKAYEIYLSNIFFVNLIPSAAVSGEVAKIYFVQKNTPDSRFDKTLAAGLVSRVLEIVPVALGAIIGVIYLSVYYKAPLWLLVFCIFIAAVISLLAITVLAISLNNQLLRSITSGIINLTGGLFKQKDITRHIQQIDAVVQQFDVSLRTITRNRSLIIISLALIMIAWVFDISIAYVAFMATGHPVSWGIVITIFSVMVMLQFLPTFLPGGLGLVDIVMTLLYLAIGVPYASAAGTTIIIRFVTLWSLTAIGGLVTLYLAKNVGRFNAL